MAKNGYLQDVVYGDGNIKIILSTVDNFDSVMFLAALFSKYQYILEYVTSNFVLFAKIQLFVKQVFFPIMRIMKFQC